MNTKSFYPNTDSPIPSKDWVNFHQDKRENLIRTFLESNGYDSLELFQAKKTGEILLKIIKDIPIKERLNYLLDLEEKLKLEIDSGLYIMIEPLGDKNSLRKLRGINIVKGYEES